MDAFTSLSQRMKVLIVACGVFLVTLSMGLMVFGDNYVSDSETEALSKVKGNVRADLLYVHPGEHK